MKRILLKRLTLKDFQGGNFSLGAEGENVSVHGRNGAGKTRLASAFSWLLYDKDSSGRSDFSIKNLDAQGEAAHGLDHSVEAVLEVDGEDITLLKTYREVWSKKRGSAQATFTGHTTEYAISGVPCQKKDYQARIAEIAGPEEIFKLLTSPTAFPGLPWQKQRQILMDVCGDLSDADVIASDSQLRDLPGILGNRSLEDHRKVITSRRTEINKELSGIPGRLDEVKRGMPDTSGLDLSTITAEIERLDTQIADAQLRLQGTATSGKMSVLIKALSEIDLQMQQAKTKHTTKHSDSLDFLNRKIKEVQTEIMGEERRFASLGADIERSIKDSEAIVPALERLRAQWVAVDAEEFQDSTSDTCPACGQNLPEERVQKAREKAVAAYNLQKAEKLSEIQRKGQALKAEKEAKDNAVLSMLQQKEGVSGAGPELREELAKLTAEREALMGQAHDFSTISGFALMAKTKERLLQEAEEEKAGRAGDTEQIKAEIQDLQGLRTLAVLDRDKFTAREKGEKRIAELMAQEKELAKEYERLEGELFLTDLFVRQKVSMLTERINSKFELVRFRLFEEQVNGGISETCQITMGGVGYNSGLNSAGRTQAGCDIVRTLQQHWGIFPPLFIDNREGCTVIPDMGSCQVISLYVSPEDKTLRVEAQA